MDDRHDFGNQAAGDVNAAGYTGATTRIGLDVGTSKVVAAQGDSRGSQAAAQLNAFIGVAYTKLAESTLQQNRVPHFRQAEELIVYGSAAERFAHMFNAECRRPMARGILNPQEPAAANVL
jgi:hypothetical protein